MQSYGAVSVGVLAILLIVWVCHGTGLGGPTSDAVLTASVEHDNPLQKAGAIFGTFLVYYGPVPFLCGVIAGVAAGNIAHQVERLPAS